jgi:hypothetical protein
MKNIRLSPLHPILLTSLLLSGLSPAANAQTAKVQAAPSLAARPAVLNGIRETKLANGLTVLTKEVHTAPVVYFSVWFKVGSMHEQLGQTGMSHLLEHMLFKGTKTRKARRNQRHAAAKRRPVQRDHFIRPHQLFRDAGFDRLSWRCRSNPTAWSTRSSIRQSTKKR